MKNFHCAHQVSIKCWLIRLLEISGQIERCFPGRMRPEIDKSGENASGEGAWSFEQTLYGMMYRFSSVNFCFIDQQQRLIRNISPQARSTSYRYIVHTHPAGTPEISDCFHNIRVFCVSPILTTRSNKCQNFISFCEN